MKAKKKYVGSAEAVRITGTTRQNVHHLRKFGILKDVIEVHAKCFLYEVSELEAHRRKAPTSKPKGHIGTEILSEQFKSVIQIEGISTKKSN